MNERLAAIEGIKVMKTFAASRSRPVIEGPTDPVVPDGLDYVVDGSVTHRNSRCRRVARLTSMRDGL